MPSGSILVRAAWDLVQHTTPESRSATAQLAKPSQRPKRDVGGTGRGGQAVETCGGRLLGRGGARLKKERRVMATYGPSGMDFGGILVLIGDRVPRRPSPARGSDPALVQTTANPDLDDTRAVVK